MSRVRAIFDLDDTLYPERSFALSAFAAMSSWAKHRLGADDLAADMVQLLDQGHLGQIFPMVLAQRGLDAAHAETLIEIYRGHAPTHLPLYPDAAPVLARFTAIAPIGLITDGTVPVQRAKVRALGLDATFAHIIYTHAKGGRNFAKPHAASFQEMQIELGQDGDHFVYIGDNPSKDFLAPNQMGWTTVQIVRPQRIHHKAMAIAGGAAHHVIETLAELSAVLKV